MLRNILPVTCRWLPIANIALDRTLTTLTFTVSNVYRLGRPCKAQIPETGGNDGALVYSSRGVEDALLPNTIAVLSL